jgi:hypothetical protein
MIVIILVFVVGCDRGPPTLVPTLAIPLTDTPVPTETPAPTEVLPPTPSPIPTETPVPIATVRRQATLRAGPGVDYAVSGSARFGQTLVVYAQCDGWLQVSGDGSQWIIDGKVNLNVEQNMIPFICRVQP